MTLAETIWTELTGPTGTDFRITTVDAGGVSTRSLQAGAGEPVIFLHGTSGHLEAFTGVGSRLGFVDPMVVTEWEPPGILGIRHAGVVTGSGRFTLAAAGGGTSFAWEEELVFPAWMGGAAGGAAAAPLLRRVWRRNLHNLKSLVEGPSAV